MLCGELRPLFHAPRRDHYVESEVCVGWAATVDGINDYEKSGSLEELLRCIGMIAYLDPVKLARYLHCYNKTILYQKAGYILEHYKDALKLPDSFFKGCRSEMPKSKRYLYRGLQREPHILSKGWALYVPVDLSVLTRKGAFISE